MSRDAHPSPVEQTPEQMLQPHDHSSPAGGPSTQPAATEAATGAAGTQSVAKVAHEVRLERLRAFYGASEQVKGIDLGFPPTR